jgi:hypothetical protein
VCGKTQRSGIVMHMPFFADKMSASIYIVFWLQIGTLIFIPKGLNHSRRAAPYVARPQACTLKGCHHMGTARV